MRIEKCESDKENSEKYTLLDDKNKQIGYGYILNQEINPIEIYIDEAERSNGYGKFLFGELIKIIKETGKKSILFDIQRADYRVANIISYYGARPIETCQNSIKYVLPIK